MATWDLRLPQSLAIHTFNVTGAYACLRSTSMMAPLYEMASLFSETWIECLGKFQRFQFKFDLLIVEPREHIIAIAERGHSRQLDC